MKRLVLLAVLATTPARADLSADIQIGVFELAQVQLQLVACGRSDAASAIEKQFYAAGLPRLNRAAELAETIITEQDRVGLRMGRALTLPKCDFDRAYRALRLLQIRVARIKRSR